MGDFLVLATTDGEKKQHVTIHNITAQSIDELVNKVTEVSKCAHACRFTAQVFATYVEDDEEE